MLDEKDLQKLLRMKRYEQPEPEYFAQFLSEFQRRQRTEILKQPLRKLLLERVQTFFQQLSFAGYGYAGATAAVLVAAGIISANILNSPVPSSRALASNSDTPSLLQTAAPAATLALNPQNDFTRFNLVPTGTRPERAINSGSSPYYVIDAQPVSYEPTSSF
jgi:hypothetical protein